MILSGILAAVITALGWVFAQIVLLRRVNAHNLFRWRLTLYVLSLASFFIWQRSTGALNILNGMFLHLLFFCTFMALYYAVVQPVTLRILVEAEKDPETVLNIASLNKVYNLNYMIQRRLDSLCARGFIFKENGCYHLTGKGIFFGHIFEKGSRFFGVR